MAAAASLRAHILSQCQYSLLCKSTYVPSSIIADTVASGRAHHVLKEAIGPEIDHLDALWTSLPAKQVIFCITLFLDGARSFGAFLTEQICDRDLPATDSARWNSAWHSLSLGDEYRHQFSREQWRFLAPTFDDPGMLLQLHANVPLPFQPGGGAERAARHSSVTQVQIPRVHQRTFRSAEMGLAHLSAASASDATAAATCANGPLIALKLFRSSKMCRFRVEHANLVFVLDNHTGAIVEMLGAFSNLNVSGILFPWAECNLKELLQGQNSVIGTNRTSRYQWLLQQMSGLASGLSFIHSPTQSMGSPVYRGRHGDLHTENLLMMGPAARPENSLPAGNLRIASFGMARFKPNDNDFGTAAPTGMYQAPEQFLELPAGSSIDVFSLGCLFLEMIIWADGGPDDYHRFAQARLSALPLSDDTIWDDFFLSPIVHESIVSGVELRPAVISWLHQSTTHASQDGLRSRLLSLIEKSMLRIKPADRISSAGLMGVLQHMQDPGLEV